MAGGNDILEVAARYIANKTKGLQDKYINNYADKNIEDIARMNASIGGHIPTEEDLAREIANTQLAEATGSAFMGGIKPTGSALARKAEGLAMDEASRLARAKEMGFDVKNPVYHGTTAKNIKEFKPGKRGETFFTSSKKTADMYGIDEGGQTLKNFVNKEGFHEVDLREADPHNIDVGEFIDEARLNKSPGVVVKNLPITDEYNNIVRREDWVIPLDQSRIRSTQAAFDPAKAASKNILAGAAGAAAIPYGLEALQRRGEK